MAAPGLLALLLVVLFPVFWALFTSVFDYTLIDPGFTTTSSAPHNYVARAVATPSSATPLWVTLRSSWRSCCSSS